jgi:thiosulfate reductase cytochrome b subunit
MAEQKEPRKKIHPLGLRVMHWVNAVAIVMMIASGWQIYDASPLFGFSFPPAVTLGGWLAAGIAWHLAMMWFLVANGLVYLAWGFWSGHFRRKFWPVSAGAVARDLRLAFTFRLKHERGVYNAVQRLLYIGVIFAGIVVVVSGLAIWKPVQLWFFDDLCGGYFAARYVHFSAMACIVAFIAVHVALVIAVPKTLPGMITGGRMPEAQK